MEQAQWLGDVEMRKIILLFFLLSLIIIAGCSSPTGQAVKENADVTVYKSSTCGCCSGYVSELKRKGFEVELINMENMNTIKSKYGIPYEMQSCHTAVFGDYFVEGHVPIEAVNRMLNEKPDFDGIALSGMPSGSPGMPGSKTETWKIYGIKDGEYSLFMEI